MTYVPLCAGSRHAERWVRPAASVSGDSAQADEDPNSIEVREGPKTVSQVSDGLQC